METEGENELALILRKLKKISRKVNDLDERMTRMEVELRTLGDLEIYAKHNPDLIAEKLLPLFQLVLNQGAKVRPAVYQKFQPVRKDSWSWKGIRPVNPIFPN